MCTVTYIPLGNDDFVLTSNRDENPLRNTIHPQTYLENDALLKYPKDELAGGTWVGLSDKKRLVCLLNGGFEIHTKKSWYKLSRGVIVKNILATDDAVSYIDTYNFTDIEPFTLVMVDWGSKLSAYELVWDGVKKHFYKLPQEPKIWSSSTLYTQKMKQLRKEWFVNFLKENKGFYQERILEFHKNDTLGAPNVAVKMKRPLVETVSITSIIKNASQTNMRYIDFVNTSKINSTKLNKVSM